MILYNKDMENIMMVEKNDIINIFFYCLKKWTIKIIMITWKNKMKIIKFNN